jgi:hypothetical protein
MKTKRIIIGCLLGTAGIVFTGAAVYIAQAAQDENRLTEKNYMVADTACREQAQRLGAIKEFETGRIWELAVPVVVDKRTALGDASAVIAACPTRTMQSFCLGPGCNDPEGSRPPPTMARRPASMIMRLALQPGAIQAITQGAPRQGTTAQGAPLPPAQSQPRPPLPGIQQPARPMQQPARPLSGVLQPQPIPQVR